MLGEVQGCFLSPSLAPASVLCCSHRAEKPGHTASDMAAIEAQADRQRWCKMFLSRTVSKFATVVPNPAAASAGRRCNRVA